MVRFLSGGSYVGEAVPVCTYWRSDVTTNKEDDFARVVGNPGGAASCVANAYFRRDQITCFNAGACNGEGKCLPCSKYKYGGMRLGITHSPPTDFLRQFDKGLTEDEIRSPNLVRFPPSVINQRDRDQVPYHILLRNIQAQIAKCCHWNQGDGLPGQFFLDRIISAGQIIEIEDENGEMVQLEGLSIVHPAFPDEVGTFFPVGTVVVAGFLGQPSFYLEPRTGLVRFSQEGGVTLASQGAAGPLARIRQVALSSGPAVVDTVRATRAVCNEVNHQLQQDTSFYSNALNTGVPSIVGPAQAKLEATQAARDVACNAADDAEDLGNEANALINQIVEATTADAAQLIAEELAAKLNELADKAEEASLSGAGHAASQNASAKAGQLRRIARNLQVASSPVNTKCEFFYADVNVAEQWNNPQDGTLPCNGVRTECQYYTGEPWIHATDARLEIGQQVTAEALQEIRFRSADWSAFINPEEEFRGRFSTPYIWAFAGYVDVPGTPDIEDMILYRPKVLFGRDTNESEYQTIQVSKVKIANFENLELEKTSSRVQPGSEVLDLDQVPQYPTLINQPTVPSNDRLQITHPAPDAPFIYRTWDPDKNHISMFGIGKPDSVVYLVNDTALRNRAAYNQYRGIQNFVDGLSTGLPGAPNFTGISADLLQSIFDGLEEESRINGDAQMLGFDKVEVDRSGFWNSLLKVDLVHNTMNRIYAFIMLDSQRFLSAYIDVDYRFIHAWPIQTSFTGVDFTIHNAGGSAKWGAFATDITKTGRIEATTQQVVGTEPVGFAYGYYGLRFRDRNLRFGTINADNDLIGDDPVADQEFGDQVAIEGGPSGFISGVGYHVVQYRKSEVVIDDWKLLNDCGFMLIEIKDSTAHRVLPLPDQSGSVKPLTDVLLNGGGRGSVVAQFAIEEATLTIAGEQKRLVQFYRNVDGHGLPANYIILGPAPEVENAFGRPVEGRDIITLTYTYLQPQSATTEGQPDVPVQPDEVVTDNFYGDTLRRHDSIGVFSEEGNLLIGGTGEASEEGGEPDNTGAIRGEQQDYVWVFTDSEGRPIGRKYSRLLVMYTALACINVEMFYAWQSTCTTYALKPDLFQQVGQNNGTLTVAPKGTIDPEELDLGFRVAALLGEKNCGTIPNCGDHEFLSLGPLRREFEVIVQIPGGGDDSPPILKAAYPSAGGPVTGEIISSERPGTQWLKRRGPLWYPYTSCERPRYDFRTNGPLGTDSTELINEELVVGGLSTGVNVIQDAEVAGNTGTFGGLMRRDLEAYRGPDRVTPRILDMHPSLRPCTVDYTHANQVLTGRNANFTGAARRRGEIDVFWYEGLSWSPPPFGNLGRPRLIFEVSGKRGDYLAAPPGGVGFRWMPLFPEREDLGASVLPFGEDLEPQHYRLIQTTNPIGSVGETVREDLRFSHKSLIQNKVAAAIEYPYVPYYPSFIPDVLLGQEPENRPPEEITGTISTMWAWREQDRPVGRGISGNVLKSLQFAAPDYFLDHRRLEVSLRPEEGLASVTFVAPTYKEDGTVASNASIRLNDGPPREVVIDFVSRTLGVASQPDTVYDTSQVLGDPAFPCIAGTRTDNPLLETPCSCIPDPGDPSLVGPPAQLPAYLQHLDSLAPPGFFALYESESLRPPFGIPLPRESAQDPCCMCVYYIRGMFFRLDAESLPSVTVVDPAFDTRLVMKYTWSRVPHGLSQGQGTDGVFNANENLMDDYVGVSTGDVFTNRFVAGNTVLDVGLDAAAIFPSRQAALDAKAQGNPIEVVDVDPSEVKFGGRPATDRESAGEDEPIHLDFTFATYVRIRSAKITFFAGSGWQVPAVRLGLVEPASRGIGAPIPTLRDIRVLAESETTADGTQVPNAQLLNRSALQQGFAAGRGAKFDVTLRPSYVNEPFWNQYGQEFQFRFAARSGINSMAIAGIELQVEAMLPGSSETEVINIPARKYYISQGSTPLNPEEYLSEEDSASAYWRTAETFSTRGANKFRAYAWGTKLEDGSDAPQRGEARDLERLQEQEYDIARSLASRPYIYQFASYIPKDEREALEFYGGSPPSWILNMSADISKVDEVLQGGSGEPVFGKVPEDRRPWHAPGHAWTYKFEENYVYCCFPCPKAMVIDYNYAHLHDGLAVVETANFWSELPSGFTRLIRSTMLLPDPTFGETNESGVGISGGTSGQAVLLDERDFTDAQGNAIPSDVLRAAGFVRLPDGTLAVVSNGSEVPVPQG